jgi:hypothetical protein
VGTAEWGTALVDYIDHHHPKLGSRLMQLRFGGLRTLELQPSLVGPVLSAGAGAGLGLRQVVGRRGDGRSRVPALPAASIGAVLAWIAVWRWDAARWRRSHVMVVVDLPDDRLDRLVAHLVGDGVDVERWDRPRQADGPNRGLACRLRDLRRVNAAIDDEISGVSR